MTATATAKRVRAAAAGARQGRLETLGAALTPKLGAALTPGLKPGVAPGAQARLGAGLGQAWEKGMAGLGQSSGHHATG